MRDFLDESVYYDVLLTNCWGMTYSTADIVSRKMS